jgi:hypothetical protein
MKGDGERKRACIWMGMGSGKMQVYRRKGGGEKGRYIEEYTLVRGKRADMEGNREGKGHVYEREQGGGKSRYLEGNREKKRAGIWKGIGREKAMYKEENREGREGI